LEGLRYTARSACVGCAREQSRRRRERLGRFPRPTPRKDALARGEKFYQGRACAHGHPGLRYVSDHDCVACKVGAYGRLDEAGRERMRVTQRARDRRLILAEETLRQLGINL
jgi:hypothetical protein